MNLFIAIFQCMKVFLLESFYGGSHKRWSDLLVRYSSHDIELFTLPARKWKWRMQNAAISFSEMIRKLIEKPEIIISSSLIDLSTLIALNRNLNCKHILYMHENQFTYPTEDQAMDYTFGYLNYKSCLVADTVIFNSDFHKESFLVAVESFLKRMPDFNNISTIETIRRKSIVLAPGIDFQKLDEIKSNRTSSILPRLLWNHRWENDKNPILFENLLIELERRQINFELVMMGKTSANYPSRFNKNIIFAGYESDYKKYLELVKSCNLLPVSSDHDFFGYAVLEAIYFGLNPILPHYLVYKEHFPEDLNAQIYYYNSDEEFINLSVKFCQNMTKPTPKLGQHIKEKYNIEEIILSFDEIISSSN